MNHRKNTPSFALTSALTAYRRARLSGFVHSVGVEHARIALLVLPQRLTPIEVARELDKVVLYGQATPVRVMADMYRGVATECGYSAGVDAS